MTSKTSVAARTLLTIGLALAALQTRVHAVPICPQEPFYPTGGLDGAPTWFDDDPTAGASSNSLRRDWLNDPRWASNARRGYVDPVDVVGTPFPEHDETTFRIGVAGEGKTLVVSYQTDTAFADSNEGFDRVFFGIASTQTGEGYAFGLKIRADTSEPIYGPQNLDRPDPSTGGRLEWSEYTWDGTTWTPIGSNPKNTKPDWVQVPALWTHDPDKPLDMGNGLWGVNFKVDLRTPDASLPETLNGIGFQGTDDVKVFSGALLMTTNWGGDLSGVIAGTQYVFPRHIGESTVSNTPIYEDVDMWHPLTLLPSLVAKCDGVHIEAEGLGRVESASSKFVTSMPFLNDSFYTMAARPQAGREDETTLPVDWNGKLEAEFRQRVWGTAGSQLAWNVMKDGAGVSTFDLAGGEFQMNCPQNVNTPGNEYTDDFTCGIMIEDLIPNSGEARTTVIDEREAHMCMFVEINSKDPNIEVVTPAVYRNMDYAFASTIHKSANINIEGLKSILGLAGARDVYLRIERRNMFEVQDIPYELDRSDMHSAVAEVQGLYRCEDPDDLCTQGICYTGCDLFDGDFAYGCSEGEANFIEGTCWCEPSLASNYDICIAPTDENLDAPRAGAAARMGKSWPTYVVHPYYATDDSYTVDGVTFPMLQAMTPFGIRIDHRGQLLGWREVLSSPDATLDRITNDLYKISVPEDGEVTLDIEIEAVEPSGDVPLLSVEGSATSWGLIGQLEIVGIAASTAPMDLSNATVTVGELLVEDGNELVSNFSGPSELTPLPGALPGAATFVGGTSPSLLMEVVDLPLIGRLTVLVGTRARVSKPSGCGFFGSADLTTSFAIDDSVHTPLLVSGTESWACVPFAMFSL